MENVVLIIHLFLALGLIVIVLMQRSEGGGLGMGSGGGGAVSGRAAATAMGKLTWILAAAFICTSIALTVIAAQKSAGSSVVDRISPSSSQSQDAPADPAPGLLGEDLLPPSADGELPAPRAD